MDGGRRTECKLNRILASCDFPNGKTSEDNAHTHTQNSDEFNKSCVAVSVFMADINYYEQTRFYEVQEKESENTNGHRRIYSLRTFQTKPNQCWLIIRTKKTRKGKWAGVFVRVNYCCSARQRKTECMPKTTHLLFTFHRQWRSFQWTFFYTECISKKDRHRTIASKKVIISAAC